MGKVLAAVVVSAFIFTVPALSHAKGHKKHAAPKADGAAAPAGDKAPAPKHMGHKKPAGDAK